MGSGLEASYLRVSQVNSLSYCGLRVLYVCVRMCPLAPTRGSFSFGLCIDYRNMFVCEFSTLEPFMVLPLASEICPPFCMFSLSLLALAVGDCPLLVSRL